MSSAGLCSSVSTMVLLGVLMISLLARASCESLTDYHQVHDDNVQTFVKILVSEEFPAMCEHIGSSGSNKASSRSDNCFYSLLTKACQLHPQSITRASEKYNAALDNVHADRLDAQDCQHVASLCDVFEFLHGIGFAPAQSWQSKVGCTGGRADEDFQPCHTCFPGMDVQQYMQDSIAHATGRPSRRHLHSIPMKHGRSHGTRNTHGRVQLSRRLQTHGAFVPAAFGSSRGRALQQLVPVNCTSGLLSVLAGQANTFLPVAISTGWASLSANTSASDLNLNVTDVFDKSISFNQCTEAICLPLLGCWPPICIDVPAHISGHITVSNVSSEGIHQPNITITNFTCLPSTSPFVLGAILVAAANVSVDSVQAYVTGRGNFRFSQLPEVSLDLGGLINLTDAGLSLNAILNLSVNLSAGEVALGVAADQFDDVVLSASSISLQLNAVEEALASDSSHAIKDIITQLGSIVQELVKNQLLELASKEFEDLLNSPDILSKLRFSYSIPK